MKTAVIGVMFLALCTPANAQFGGLLDKARQARDAKKKVDTVNVSEADELALGAAVSEKVRARFGVVQDREIHRYVTLVGLALAEQSERPSLPWTFVVLDTDGVNAFAAPGGIVHITRGALGLVKTEAELAAVLGHEIGHVAHKHTVDAIRKANAQKLAAESALADRGPYLERLTNLAYDMVIEGKFDRGDELDADSFSVGISRKLGYAPGRLADFLGRLAERNKDSPDRNGLFASHPEINERIQKIRALAGSTPGADAGPRYASNVKYEAAALTAIARIPEGSAGLTGSGPARKDERANKDEAKAKDTKKEEPRRGFGLGSLRRTVTPEQQSTQVSASGGSRGVGPDRLAAGGNDPSPVTVTVTAAEIVEFKKGIV